MLAKMVAATAFPGVFKIFRRPENQARDQITSMLPKNDVVQYQSQLKATPFRLLGTQPAYGIIHISTILGGANHRTGLSLSKEATGAVLESNISESP